jgi:hypothetical protein
VTTARRATATERGACARRGPRHSPANPRLARSTRVPGLGSSTAKQVAAAARARGLVTAPIRHAVGRPYAAALRLQLASIFSPAGGARAPCRVSFVTYYVAPTWIRPRIYMHVCRPLVPAGDASYGIARNYYYRRRTDRSVGSDRPFSIFQPPAHPPSCRPRQAPFAASDPSRKRGELQACRVDVSTGGVVDRASHRSR